MNSDFQVVKITSPETDNSGDLSIDDYLISVEQRRERIKTLCSVFISVSGILFSANSVILFFSIRDAQDSQRTIGVIGSVVVGSILASTVAASVRALYPIAPLGVFTKQQRLEHKLQIYRRELSLMRRAYWLLMTSVVTIIVQMVFIAVTQTR